MTGADQATNKENVRSRTKREASRDPKGTVVDARQRLTSSSGTRASFDFELLDEYADSRMSGMLALPALLLILALFASLWVPVLVAASWAGVVIVANIALVLLCRRFKRTERSKFNAGQWTTSFVAAETVYGIAWSLLALFTLTNDDPYVRVAMFAMVLVGTAANSIATRTLPGATLMSTLPATLTVSINLVVSGGTINYALAAVTLGGEIFFVYLARQMHGSELERVEHQAEKDALIYELEEARHMSDEARRHAEQANIAKSQFLATMSHELRTPLTSIIGNADLMEMLRQSPRDRLVSLHAIQDSGRHLLHLLNDLLDLSRIEAGKYDLNEKAISLVAVAEECRSMMKARADAKSIDFSVSYSRSLPKLWGDERAVRQVVLNLLSNAIKFTPQSGKVTLMVTRSGDGGQVISVRDNGPGIPEEEIETVLSSFGQGSLAHKTAEQGAGLGLPIVQKIMDLHQGRFDLFSKVGFGTEVIVTFPLTRSLTGPTGASPRVASTEQAALVSGAPRNPRSTAPADMPSGADDTVTPGNFSSPGVRIDSDKRIIEERFGTLNVLIVEDDVAIMHVLRSVVRNAGHKVSTAVDGETALALLEEVSFDCVLLDMNLPGIRGTEVKIAFDEMQGKAGTDPVFFAVTGDVLPSQLENYRASGFLGVVGKPFEHEDILAALDRAIRFRSHARSDFSYPPEFDADRIMKVERALAHSEFIEGLVQAAASLKTSAEKLAAAIEAQDRLKMRKAYHSIAGTAGQYGLMHLHDAAKRAEIVLERSALDQDAPVAEPILQLIGPAVEAITLLRSSRWV